jgi:hypothetical protein
MIKYLVVSQQPDGSDLTHSKHIGEHDALKSLYQIKAFVKKPELNIQIMKAANMIILAFRSLGLN